MQAGAGSRGPPSDRHRPVAPAPPPAIEKHRRSVAGAAPPCNQARQRAAGSAATIASPTLAPQNASVADHVTWLGHSTVLLELAGVRLITDPVLRRRVAHLRRVVPPPEPPGRLDAVLVSHLHLDHLDMPSLRRLDDAAILVVPRGGARVVRRLGHAVVELAAGEELDLRHVRVRAVPAVHDGRRSPAGQRADAIGFIVEQRVRIYFAGDTERYDGMASFAPLDLALLPIWGWGPSVGAGHMDPEQAAAATALLSPNVAVPIHWGTLAAPKLRRGPPPDDPARRFVARCAELAPATRVQVLRPGDSHPLDAPRGSRHAPDAGVRILARPTRPPDDSS